MLYISSTHSKTVFVGMSGGVDSAVSAAILKSQGFHVVGVYMKNWSGDEYGIQADCPWQKDMDDVRSTCEKLDIEFRSYNFELEYRERVVDYFFSEYSKGRTPNPDVMCNREIKFDMFLKKAMAEGADHIATGHYARILENESGFHLLKGKDRNKDQSYFLCTLGQFELSRTIFPVGDMQKSEVRALAKKFDIPVAEKKDSQGICFIGDIDVKKFLRANIQFHPGIIVDEDTGEEIGEHDGIAFYTIGQREGLNHVKVRSPHQLPYFISRKDEKDNILYAVQGTDNPRLFKNEIELENWNSYFLNLNVDQEYDIEISIRYRQTPIKSKLSKINDKFIVKFSEPVRAISSGQIAVGYENDELLGWGVIK